MESIALYFQEKADLIASNDDRVRAFTLSVWGSVSSFRFEKMFAFPG